MSDQKPSVILRPARMEDRDAIAAIWHASASLPGVGPPAMPSLSELRERADLEFASGWNVTIALRAGGIAGFLALRPEEGILDQLFVHPGGLGQGVGKALLAHAMETMPEGFTLYTRPSNRRACHFYEKMGLVLLRHGIHPRSGDPIIYYGWCGRRNRQAPFSPLKGG